MPDRQGYVQDIIFEMNVFVYYLYLVEENFRKKYSNTKKLFLKSA